MTVWSWLNDKTVVPHQLAIRSIKVSTPDCPILQEARIA